MVRKVQVGNTKLAKSFRMKYEIFFFSLPVSSIVLPVTVKLYVRKLKLDFILDKK